jgi:hypothetical protein
VLSVHINVIGFYQLSPTLRSKLLVRSGLQIMTQGVRRLTYETFVP